MPHTVENSNLCAVANSGRIEHRPPVFHEELAAFFIAVANCHFRCWHKAGLALNAMRCKKVRGTHYRARD